MQVQKLHIVLEMQLEANELYVQVFSRRFSKTLIVQYLHNEFCMILHTYNLKSHDIMHHLVKVCIKLQTFTILE